MAWSAPVAFATLEIPPAAKLNTIQDNLTYLHGDAGAVSINNTLQINAGGASQNIVLGLSGAAGSFAGLSVGRTASESHFAVPGATNQFFTGTQAGDMLFKIDDNSKNIVFGGTAMRAAFTSAGVGIGTNAPAGALHVLGAGAIAGAGLVIGSVAAVTSIQTVFAAGTVARGALFLILDRDSGSVAPLGIAVGGPFAMTLSSSATYNPGGFDTITIAVTAAGAVTAQRTAGTHGTHDITIFAILT